MNSKFTLFYIYLSVTLIILSILNFIFIKKDFLGLSHSQIIAICAFNGLAAYTVIIPRIIRRGNRR